MERTEKRDTMYVRDRYQIEKILNRGGFGITYLAKDRELCENVVLKKYQPIEYESDINIRKISRKSERRSSYEKGKRDFLKEARILSSLFEVKEVVKILDYFEENGDAYIVMEYVSGMTLRQYIENSCELMNFEQAWTFLLPVINALEKVHEKNLIHRDISPDNIIVRKDGSLKLIDFGSARQYADGKTTMTAIIKNGYAPPEQYETKGKQGPWTDIYSICATIYEMITGVIPQSAIQRQEQDKMYPPSSYGCEITPQQEKALMKGLSLDYRKRYQNIIQLQRGILSEQKKETDNNEKDSTSKQKRRKYKLIAAGILTGIFITGAASVQKYRADLSRARQKEQQERSLNRYPRNSPKRQLLLKYLAKYGQYKGELGTKKIYVLPEWTLRKINVRCDNDFFTQTREEYISYLRREGISLKFKARKYRGDLYIEPVAGTIETYFTYTDIYDIGQNYGINIIYDIATHEITRVLYYRKNQEQKLDDLIQVVSESMLFFSKEWDMPPKIAQREVRNLVEDYEKEERSEGYYSWNSTVDCSVGCKTEKKYGTILQIFRYTGI